MTMLRQNNPQVMSRITEVRMAVAKSATSLVSSPLTLVAKAVLVKKKVEYTYCEYAVFVSFRLDVIADDNDFLE